MLIALLILDEGQKKRIKSVNRGRWKGEGGGGEVTYISLQLHFRYGSVVIRYLR